MAKKKLNTSNESNQIQVTGKEEGFAPTRLDQIMGTFNELAIYGTKNEDEYQSRIFGMDITELQEHASRIGVVPLDDVDRLRTSLIREFRVYNKSLYKPVLTNHLPDKIPDHIKKILDIK